jgi:hypothetical protein
MYIIAEMKSFVALSPDLGTPAVSEFRTRDDDATLAALKAATPPFDDEVSAELVGLAYGLGASLAHPLRSEISKLAKKLVQRNVDGTSAFAIAFRGIGKKTHELDKRIRVLRHPLRVAIAKSIAFHTWGALSVPFEEDAEFRGAILDVAVARAKRDKESMLKLHEIYTELRGRRAPRATTTDFHVLPEVLARELTARRKTYTFTGLCFHGSSLTDLPASLATAKWLTELVLTYNPIEQVPAVVFELANLETLDLSSSRIDDIPPALSKLRKLHTLALGSKYLQHLPDAVCEHDQLRELQIGQGAITELPPAIAGMHSLEVLDLQSTRISRLPEELATLPKLRLVRSRYSRLNVPKARAILPKHVKIET